jgi:hypothetical protein
MTRTTNPAIEQLESRTLLSGTLGLVAMPLPSTKLGLQATPPVVVGTGVPIVTGPTLNMTAGVPFKGVVGFYASPVLDPPLVYSANIYWGDGGFSKATVSYGQQGTDFGLIISGAHTYTRAGTFKVRIILVTGPINPLMGLPTRLIEEIVDKAIVAPRPGNSAGGVTILETAGKPFAADVGTFITIAPGTGLSANISWDDGTTSAGTLTAVGVVGIDEIQFQVTGTHTYTLPGKYPIHIDITKPSPFGGLQPPPVVATIDSTAVVTLRTYPLDGTIAGAYSPAPVASPIGATYLFKGTGTAGGLGPVAANGSITIPGANPYALAFGTLTLTSLSASPVAGGGSATLRLVAPIVPVASTEAMAAFPTTFYYVITGGTGDYANATGTGTITVTLDPTMSFTFVIKSFLPPTPVAL